METSQWLALLADVLLIVSGFYLSINTRLIKDISCMPDNEKPYSFARTQLLWWTLIVMSCFIYYAIVYIKVPQLNPTALLLLGISAATTASGAIIDGTDMKQLPQKIPDDKLPDGQKADELERHQDTITKGFWNDLLSDAQGTSIHRFQCLIVNVVVGIVYLSLFFKDKKFPDFDTNYVTALLGLSSAGYITLKAGENKPEVLKTIKEEDKNKMLIP